MGRAALHDVEELSQAHADSDGDNEEGDDLDGRHARVGVEPIPARLFAARGKAREDGEDDDAEDVVDDCRRDDGGAHLPVELSELF